ncbi:CRISPR-associated endonuclease Cas3'' [Pyrodictium delaneyi]|uniref:CRISPR-associated endonuclease Cas3'' n=1 Tax=Pyrodictium delaneyi TaxID=1273541 RepID=UPI0015D865D7|nr:CRISPR-associated endonuclease Cas3'' [Pyrodictium delaneyi]
MALYAWARVRLGHHSCNVAGLLLGLFSEELRVTANRLGVNAESLYIAAAIAALLHDAGKASPGYQERVATRPVFTCHELVAGKLVLDTSIRILEGRIEDKYAQLLAGLAGLAALRHHHGMRSIDFCRREAKKGRVHGLSREDFALLASEFEETCPPSRPIIMILNSLDNDYDPLGSLIALSKHVENLTRIVGFREEGLAFYASQLTGFLSLADYLAASILDGRRKDNEHPRGYAATALKELSWRLMTGIEGKVQLTDLLKGIAMDGIKFMKRLLSRL